MIESAEVASQTPARLPRDARYCETKREVDEFLYDEA